MKIAVIQMAKTVVRFSSAAAVAMLASALVVVVPCGWDIVGLGISAGCLVAASIVLFLLIENWRPSRGARYAGFLLIPSLVFPYLAFVLWSNWNHESEGGVFLRIWGISYAVGLTFALGALVLSWSKSR